VQPGGADDAVFSTFVRGNERFGRTLLEKVHSNDPEHNVVVSPISLTIVLAALREESFDQELFREISSAFGWQSTGRLAIPARMLLKAFEPPKPPSPLPPGPLPRGMSLEIWKQLRNLDSPEESWITNTFLYRSKVPRSGRSLHLLAPRFVDTASRNFGMKFVGAGAARPTLNDLRRADKSIDAIPAVSSENDVWISSSAHLRTAWRGNTFSMSTPFTGEFRTAAGETRQVEMITSELAEYPHAITASFEAVVLPCQSAYMIAVLPAPGKDIHALERELAGSPETLDSVLNKEPGEVTMPTFHIVFAKNLRPQLEQMGIQRVFSDLGDLIRIPKSHLTEVAQTIDFQADQEGIRASAETVTGAIYGGIMAAKPFKMRIDRPFLFFVHDYNANALLFLGAVMDPTRKH
jgi:serpin B